MAAGKPLSLLGSSLPIRSLADCCTGKSHQHRKDWWRHCWLNLLLTSYAQTGGSWSTGGIASSKDATVSLLIGLGIALTDVSTNR